MLLLAGEGAHGNVKYSRSPPVWANSRITLLGALVVGLGPCDQFCRRILSVNVTLVHISTSSVFFPPMGWQIFLERVSWQDWWIASPQLTTDRHIVVAHGRNKYFAVHLDTAAWHSPSWLMKVKVLVTQLCPTLCNPRDCNPPCSSSVKFSWQEYWRG